MAYPEPAPDDEIPLDERIALLTRWRESPPEGVDLAALRAELGAAFLELYERDRDVDHLAAGIAEYQQAVRSAPEHDDRAQWCYWLGLSFAELATRQGSPELHDQAAEWLARARAALPAGDPDQDHIAATLIDLHWQRFQMLRYGQPCDAAAAEVAARRAMAAIAAVPVSGEHPEVVEYQRMVIGMGHVACYDEAPQRSDLEDGIAALVPALAALPPDTTEWTSAAGDLCYAYLERASLDESPTDVDLAIAAGERATDLLGPAVPAETDPLDWRCLHAMLADGYQIRWNLAERPTDLRHAIEHWQVVLDSEVSPSAAAAAGDLRCQRAELNQDPADLAEAIRLLEYAADAADLPAEAETWRQLAWAYRTRWNLGSGDLQDLTAAADRLDHLLDLDLPEPVACLIHLGRIEVAHDRLSHEDSQPHTGTPAGARALARHLARARSFLDRATSLTVDQRGLLATVLALREIFLGAFAFEDIDLDRIAGLLAVGRQATDLPAVMSAYLDTGEGLVAQARDARRSGPGGDAGVRALARAAASPHLDEAERWTLRKLVPMAGYSGAVRRGDIRGERAAVKQWGGPTGGAPAGTAPDPEHALVASFLSTIAEVARLPPAEVPAMAARLRELATAFSAAESSSYVRRFLRPMAVGMVAMLDGASDDSGHPESIELPEATGPMASFALTTHVIAAAASAAASAVGALRRQDLTALRHHRGRLAELVDQFPAGDFPAGDLPRLGAIAMAGVVEWAVAEVDPTDQAAAGRAANWLGEACRLASDEHPAWPFLAMVRARAMRTGEAGEPAGARAVGRSALRGHGWQVMLQAGTDFGLEAANRAAADAMTVAGWCQADLAAGDGTAAEDLVAALDAGRGLVLHAATASRDVAGQLRAAGHPELAREWRDTGGLGRDQLTGDPLAALATATETPDDLRVRVLRALDTAGLGPLAPVALAEIPPALAAQGADALVYLLPGDGDRAGAAVVVPVSGRVAAIPLPDLVAGPGSPVRRHLRATTATRDAAPAAHTAPATLPTGPPESTVDDLCRWAWSAAMRDLLGYAARWHLRRPARLVLVPMGMLGLVPWHAALTGDGAARRYAVEDAVISYAVSARMLVATARRPLRAVRSALIVGDPTGDLPFAGVEARAVHRRFYPDGTFLGRGGDEIGTPRQVLDWIGAATGPSTLHFACHGAVEPGRPADAHLRLAGGELAARDLVEASRLAALDLDRVFLAACTTNVTGSDYDEALGLATAFLAAGAGTVFGSLWRVPDAATSLLMYVVHHHLEVDGCAPVDALHRAQLWMLDPNRRAPVGMPPELDRHRHRPDLAAAGAWAAFTHLGR